MEALGGPRGAVVYLTLREMDWIDGNTRGHRDDKSRVNFSGRS
jgi:hypothetical protein